MKTKFIDSWGAIGIYWGMQRMTARVHALLLVSDVALSYDEIMGKLDISRGGANASVRELLNLGLVQKQWAQGEKREYFEANKDIDEVTRILVADKMKRELLPLQKILAGVTKKDGKVLNEIKSKVGLVAEMIETFKSK